MTTTLIVPGLRGSSAGHWQTWIEARIPGAVRVQQADWNEPVLARWADVVRGHIDRASGSVWIVAHSFGCLATVVAAQDRRDRVAGAMLVAPADPERFSPAGLRTGAASRARPSVAALLPQRQLGFASVVVASTNDPWVPLASATAWADRWGSAFVNFGPRGHINVESGFGPWPWGLELFQELRATQVGGAPGAFSPLKPCRGEAARRICHPGIS